MALDHQDEPVTPGQRIKRARLAAGISPAKLASALEISQQGVQAFEAAGADNFPKLPNALKIARLLRMDPWEIAFGDQAELVRRSIKPLVVDADEAESLQQDDDRLVRLEADLREMRAIVDHLEDIAPKRAGGSKGRRKRRRSG